jgi:GT2 family glycosyltransferase
VKSLSVIVPNWNGENHLRDCLSALRQQDYAGPIETVVVDNGSTDRSMALVSREYPWVRLVRLETNLGFATACNRGAKEASGDLALFLNNDTRVDSGWARELSSSFDDSDVAAAGAKILDWQGQHLDFVGGTLSFFGHAHQISQGEADQGRFDVERNVLFPCGGAMAVRREVFLEVGGFDEDYFIYFEDVDIGWRLWIMGYKVVFCPRAVTYHRLSSTRSRRVAESTKLLYERNALATITKNYDDANLARILPAALLLCAVRCLDFTEIDEHLYRPEAWRSDLKRPPDNETVSRVALSHLVAVEEYARNLDLVLQKRAQVQAKRRRQDCDILPLFGAPFLPALLDSDRERRAIGALRDALGLEALFGGSSP